MLREESTLKSRLSLKCSWLKLLGGRQKSVSKKRQNFVPCLCRWLTGFINKVSGYNAIWAPNDLVKEWRGSRISSAVWEDFGNDPVSRHWNMQRTAEQCKIGPLESDMPEP